MNLETEIYQILKKHRLSLKKREEVIVDLLDFIKKRDEAMNYSQCCESDSEQLKSSFKKGDAVLLDNSQKVIYIEDLRNDEIMLRHIAGYKLIVNASRVSSL
jgi:hypothetical protein